MFSLTFGDHAAGSAPAADSAASLVSSFNDVLAGSQRHGVNMRTAAYMLAIERVAATGNPAATAFPRSLLDRDSPLLLLRLSLTPGDGNID